MKIDMEGAVVPEWTLGDRLKKAREHAGLSQDELAANIGISTSSVSRYEIDKTTPNRPVVVSWAICTNCDLGWLVGGGAINSFSSPAPTAGHYRLGLAA